MATSHARPLVRMSPWSAGRYRSFSGWLYSRLRLRRTLKICRKLPASEVLEIGCHDMLFYQLLSRRFRRYVGLDRKPYMPRLAGDQDHLDGNVSVRQGMAEALPFEDESFDTLLSFETVPQLADEDRAVTEIERVLKPGGSLILSVPIEYGLLLPFKALAEWFWTGKFAYTAKELLQASLLCRPERATRRMAKGYDYRHTLERLRSRGLVVERIERLPFGWLPSWLNLGAILVLSKPGQRSEPVANRELQFHRGHAPKAK